MMEALTLLRDVSDAYRNLRSLAVEAVIANESGDENSNQRNEQRVRFFYEAPDRFRYEPCGREGVVQVSDGKQLHNCFLRRGLFEGGPRYHSMLVNPALRLPHSFDANMPSAAAFLYSGICERVAAAEILREEEGCHVVSVTYEPSLHPFVVSGPAVLFWVDAKTRMVMRQQAQQGHRFPAGDDVHWSRHTLSVRSMQVNEAIPEGTFDFTPPEDAKLETGGQCGVSMSGGSGFAQTTTDGRRVEHRGSHTWEGDTLVEHSTWKLHEMTLTFERRLTFSADEKQLRVDEKISGPKGVVETSSRLPVG
jgi:hypothetical protein